MGTLVFQATLGGQVNLTGPNTASTFTISVPAITGNMITSGDTGTVTNTMLAGSIANAKLLNSNVTIGSTSVALGATVTAFAGLTGLSSSSITNSGLTTGRVMFSTTGGLETDSANLLYSGTDLTVYGITVGRGAGAVATNTAVGASALAVNTSGVGNTALGDNALLSNTTASRNTVVGYQAGYTNQTAGYNTFLGNQAGYSYNTTGDTVNTFVGSTSGYSTSSGTSNSFFGAGSGNAVTTGNSNTIIGRYSGNQGGLDIRTASNNIVLSDGDGNPRGVFDASGSLIVGGTSAVAAGKIGAAFAGNVYAGLGLNDTTSTSGCGFVTFQIGGTTIGSISRVVLTSAVSYNTTSDQRLKSNIANSESVIDKLMQVQVRQYDWTEGQVHQDYGFIAQELKPILSGIVTEGKTEEDMWQLDYSKLTPHLVKAIQEQQVLIQSLKARLDAANL